MLRCVWVVVFAVFAAAGCRNGENGDPRPEVPARRLLVLSLDGLAWDLAQRKMGEGKMPHLAALVARGASAEGSVAAWPAKTAPSHASLWTGRWADGHGIMGNETPLLPHNAHTVFELRSGFDAEALRAEPIWRAAARQGRIVTVVQATQADPGNPDDSGLPGLNIFGGYRDRVDSALVTAGVFAVDGRTFAIERDEGGLVVSSPPVRVRVRPGEFVAVDHPDVRGVFYLAIARLDDRGWTLLRSSYSRVSAPSSSEAAEFRRAVGGYAYNAQKLGDDIRDGSGWKRDLYVAATRLNAERVRAAVLWAMDRHPADLTIAYLPQPDEALHALLGRIDLLADREAESLLDDVLGICDGLIGDLAAAVGDRGAIAVVSDHGMAPADRVFFPNLALERAGLLERDAAGRINLSKSQAVFSAAGDCVVINTADRVGGIVPTGEKDAWLQLAERALSRAAESALGAGTLEMFRPDGNSSDLAVGAEGDLWLAATCDGVRLNAVFSADLPPKDAPLSRSISPVGTHSGDPRIPRLRGIAVYAGTGFRHVSAPGVRNIDFAPTVARWLAVDPSLRTAGRPIVEFLEER